MIPSKGRQVGKDSGKVTVVKDNTPLRRWREDAGLTLEDESGLTGYSVPFLSRLERGTRGLRPLDRVRFARALGVPVSEIFEPDAPRDPK